MTKAPGGNPIETKYERIIIPSDHTNSDSSKNNVFTRVYKEFYSFNEIEPLIHKGLKDTVDIVLGIPNLLKRYSPSLDMKRFFLSGDVISKQIGFLDIFAPGMEIYAILPNEVSKSIDNSLLYSNIMLASQSAVGDFTDKSKQIKELEGHEGFSTSISLECNVRRWIFAFPADYRRYVNFHVMDQTCFDWYSQNKH